jgi:hypothetical protein
LRRGGGGKIGFARGVVAAEPASSAERFDPAIRLLLLGHSASRVAVIKRNFRVAGITVNSSVAM